jgi:hypothetical protein
MNAEGSDFVLYIMFLGHPPGRSGENHEVNMVHSQTDIQTVNHPNTCRTGHSYIRC